jgi:hypothetical protein
VANTDSFNPKGNEMTKSKFTPGPWRVLHDPIAPRSKKIGAAGKRFAIVGSYWMPLAEIEANAELMADAPRMLEVLRKVLTYADMSTGWQHLDEAEQAFTEAHELLEKHGG